MKKVSIKQLAKLLMEEKKPLAKTEEEDDDSFGKDFLSKSWGDDEEADPKLDFVDEARLGELAGIVLSEQPISGEQATQMQSDEDKKAVEAEAQSTGDATYDALFDVVTEALNGSIGLGGLDDPHPAVYRAIVEALRSVADDVEVEMNNVHPREFITLWEPGHGPGSK